MKKLYMVSIGPGDYELVTIKALKALKNSSTICIPTKSKDSFDKSFTYKIVEDLMREFDFAAKIKPIYSPMKFKEEDWQKQVDSILEEFKDSEIISFVTLGDCAIYSTVYYLLDIIKNQNKKIYQNCEIIPGITSFSLSSAKVKKPLCLGNIGLEIIPLLDKKVPKTKVYMRPKIGMDTKEIKSKGEFFTFENLNTNEESILNHKKEKVEKYMTLFIDFVK